MKIVTKVTMTLTIDRRSATVIVIKRSISIAKGQDHDRPHMMITITEGVIIGLGKREKRGVLEEDQDRPARHRSRNENMAIIITSKFTCIDNNDQLIMCVQDSQCTVHSSPE